MNLRPSGSEPFEELPATGNTEVAVAAETEETAEYGEIGHVNQQASGENILDVETPVESQTEPKAIASPENDGLQPPDDAIVPDTTPTTIPDSVSTAITPAPQQGNDSIKPDMTFVVEQKEDIMVVTTGYCVVEYPFAFSEIIQVTLTATNTGAALEFTASIRGQTAPLYTLWLNTDQGIPYGTVTTNGYSSSVHVETYAPTGLTEENLVTFNAAQETINEVLQSLERRNAFVASE